EIKESGQKTDDSDKERADPGDSAIDEDSHQRQQPRDEPVKAQEGSKGEKRFAGRGEEHEAQKDSRNPLEQEDPPDVRLLGPFSCYSHHVNLLVACPRRYRI